jgi:hypothetical protein
MPGSKEGARMKRIILSRILVFSLVAAFVLSVAPGIAQIQIPPDIFGFGQLPPDIFEFLPPEMIFGGGMPVFQDIPDPFAPEFLMPGQAQEQKPCVFKISVVDSLITADIADCPMQTAFQDLSERTGIIFRVVSQDDPIVSARIRNADVRDAIQQMAPGHNIVFYYDENFPEYLIMAQVFPRIRIVLRPELIYLGTGAVTKIDIDTPEQAIKALAEDSHLDTKEEAVDILFQNKSDEGIKALRSALSDPEPQIRIAVIAGFAALGVREALPGIVKCLKDENPEVRQSAITAVAMLGDARNIKDIEPLKADKDLNVAISADKAVRILSAKEGR